MIGKKKGFLVLGILLISILYFPYVLGQGNGNDGTDGETSTIFETYESLGMWVNCDSKSECSGEKETVSYCPPGDCTGDCDARDFPPTDPGCRLYVTEEDDYSDDACVAPVFPPGYNVDETYKNTEERINRLADITREVLLTIGAAAATGAIIGGIAAGVATGGLGALGGAAIGAYLGAWVGGLATGLGLVDDNEDAVTAARYAPFNFKAPNGVLCGNDHEWLQCDENHVDFQYWITMPIEIEKENPADPNQKDKVTINFPAALYECTETEDSSTGTTIYVWREKKPDLDKDGYEQGPEKDCWDFPYFDPYPDCPKIKANEYQGLTQEQIRELAKEKCEENPKYGQCAICINPNAPEVCGDGLNNDCGGPQAPQPVIDPADPDFVKFLQPTPDDCHTFREGCEQKTFTETGHPADVAGAEAGADEDTPDFANLRHTNIYGESFDWIDLEEGTGYCCGLGDSGHNAIGDLGKVGKAVDGDYLCLNKNFVGSAPEKVEDIYWGPSDSTGAGCQGDWCWIPANGASAFHVLTLKPPGQQPYDIVSNNEEWRPCTADPDLPKTLPLPQYEGTEGKSFLEVANRFHCYQEGEHWSWAECHGSNEGAKNANTIKGRLAGEGLYSLYLVDKDTNPNGELYGPRIEVNLDKGQYREFYDQAYLRPTSLGPAALDFAYYDHLEFMLRFAADETGGEITPENKNQVFHVPAKVLIEIRGPEQLNDQGAEEPVIYLQRQVLGDLANNPVWEGNRWMHVKVPLPRATTSDGGEAPLKEIKQIIFTSEPSTNIIGLKNVRLSKAGEDSKICSGEDDFTASSWLTDLDAGNRAQTKVTAENLCTALYGDQAWLGNDDEVDAASANCCGNGLQPEYYAGKSRLQEEGKFYGCWNSQPIADGKTTMNVEYSVTYREKNKEVQYQGQSLTDATLNYIQSSVKYVPFDSLGYLDNWCTKPIKDNCPTDSLCYNPEYPQPENPGTCPEATAAVMGEKYDLLSEVPLDFSKLHYVEELVPADFSEENKNQYRVLLYVEEKITLSPIPDQKLSYLQPYLLVDDDLSLRKQDFQWNGEPYGEAKLVLTVAPEGPEGVEAFFLNPVTKDVIISPQTITAGRVKDGPTPFYIMLRSNNLHLEANEVETTETKTFTYICADPQGECLYPLPGEPGTTGYTITNSHPELYELSFVYGPNKQDEIPVGNQLTTPADTPGMVKARKVAQQILFINTGEDVEQPDVNFYGCAAPTSLQQNLPADFTAYADQEYCASQGNHFCSPSYPIDKVPGDPKERYTLINSWSDKPVEQVGYLPPSMPELPADPAALYQGQPLLLRASGADAEGKSPPFPAQERTQLTSVLPARNFLSNAAFQTVGNELPHWELFDAPGKKIDNERGPSNNLRIHDGQVDLAAGEKLHTERLAVPQQAQLHFSSSSSCEPGITLIDQDGQAAGAAGDLAVIETATASYAVLTFTGSCTVKEPLLQLRDDLGPASYAQAQREVLASELTDNTARSGLACCPQNYCWNGYACVEPMGPYTYLAEHITEGRDYRCLNGEWKHLPVKKDWHNQNWGFCEQTGQCFVQSSTEGASKEYTLQQFYEESKVPTCINDGQFLFDHYCQQGAWSSRTKFLATKLLEVAGEEYVLYCTNYKDALLSSFNLGDKEQWLGGGPAGSVTSTAELGEAIGGETSTEEQRTCFTNLQLPGLVRPEENHCLNNVCVLKKEDGAVSLATALNTRITDQAKSFFYALNIPPEEFEQVCAGSGDFIECNLAGLEIEGDLWYSPAFNAVVYGKPGISLTPGLLDTILSWFNGLFGLESPLSEEKKFVDEAENFRELYLLATPDKKVRAMQELFPDKKMLVAEYENFDTPVCDYVTHLQTSAAVSPLEAAAGQEKLSCTTQGNVQRVEALAALDVFWPQLTGRLRVG